MIGILTYHRVLNYGAVLQAYALQEKIHQLGKEVGIVDHWGVIDNKKEFFKCRKPKDFASYFLRARSYNRKYNKFYEFWDNYLNLITYDQANKFITGSDQVWNYKINNFDKFYFLSCLDDKNSYAASFGLNKIPEEHKARYKDLLDDYKNISVREETGAEIINDLLGFRPEVVVDPVFLLSNKDWEKIAIIPDDDNFVLVYAFSWDNELLKMAKREGKKVIAVLKPLKPHFGIDFKTDLGPREFLGYIIKADKIFTNSFHGTCFSILFDKDFYVKPPEGKGSRIEQVLSIKDDLDTHIKKSEEFLKKVIE